MKRSNVRLIAIAAILLVACIALFLRLPKKPKTGKEQFSYVVGVNFARGLKMQNLDLESNKVISGILDGLQGHSLLTEPESAAALSGLAGAQQQKVQSDSDKNKAVADEFLAKNRSADGVMVTKSGLQYKIIQEGNGLSPKPQDKVVVNFKGTFVGGGEFGSTKPGQPAEFEVRGVLPGWSEGLQLMKKGGKSTFYIPPELGYGERPRQHVPGNSVIVMDVELLDIKPAKTK